MDNRSVDSIPANGHLFLSYASVDRVQALGVADALEAAGTPVWIDRRGISGGEMWAAEITAAIRSCSAVVLLCTEASLHSRNVRQEVQLAWDHERTIVPLVAGPMEFPDEFAYFLQGRQWIELDGAGNQNWISAIVRAIASPGAPALARRALDRSPWIESNLPIPPSEILGRDSQISEISEMLQNPQTRLITLVGPGGVGKTRLALEVAWQFRNQTDASVTFVNLAPVRDADLVLPTIAESLGMTAGDESHLIQQMKAVFRHQQLLLVLDNFEQVLRAAEQVGQMLANVAGLQMIVTSREPLRLRAEQIVEVPPLSVAASIVGTDISSISQDPAIALFVTRARAANARFSLTTGNAGAVSEICRRLDGLPLAIELAASRTALLSPEIMLQRMIRRLPLLTGGARDLPERQRTLRNTIAWSEDLLTPDEQAVFRRMAVLVGGCSLESSLAVTDTPGEFRDESDVFHAIERLISHSLLREVSAIEGEVRFQMFETVREYALDRLESAGELAEANARHAGWFLDLAEGTESGLIGPDHLVWFERLKTEQDNLRAALAWSVENDPEMALRFSAGLAEFWVSTSAHQEGLLWCERALETASATNPEYVAGAALTAARLAYRVGNSGSSRSYAELALAHYEGIGDERGVMRAMSAFGSTFLTEGESKVRAHLLNDALRRARAIGDDHYVALIANNIAIREWNVDALGLFDEAIAIARSQGNEIGKTLFLLNQAELLAELGQYERALPVLQEALASQSLLNHRNATEGLVAVTAVLLGVGGDPILAVRLHAAAAAEFEHTGSVTLEGEIDLRGSSRAMLRQRLGDQIFETAWREGQSVSLTDALAEARHGLENWAGLAT